jgi:hypothetical protein
MGRGVLSDDVGLIAPVSARGYARGRPPAARFTHSCGAEELTELTWTELTELTWS